MTQCDTSFFMFSGFRNISQMGNGNREYRVDLQYLNISWNMYSSWAEIFTINPFVDENETKIRIMNSHIDFNIMNAFGGLIIARNNMKNSILVQNTTFIHNQVGYFLIQPYVVDRKDLALKLELRNILVSNTSGYVFS